MDKSRKSFIAITVIQQVYSISHSSAVGRHFYIANKHGSICIKYLLVLDIVVSHHHIKGPLDHITSHIPVTFYN